MKIKGKYNEFCDKIVLEKRNIMLDIENVNGIIIAPDGSFRKFGVYKDAPFSELSEMNFHDSAFRIEVSNSKWFKKLKRKLNINYNNENIHKQGMGWAADGAGLLIHGGGGDGEFYGVIAPLHLSNQQRILFENNYNFLKNQIIKNDVYFEAVVIDDDGNYADDALLFGLENFYDRMGLQMSNRHIR